MPATMEIFCRSDQSMTRQTIIEFIRDGVYFDDPPHFTPPAGSEAAASASWSFLEIRYQPDKRPVQISHYSDGQEYTESIQEAVDRLRAGGLAVECQGLRAHLQASRQMFVVEVGFLEVPAECWEMVDGVEAFMATTLDGIISAPEGFYNQQLQLICKT